MATLPESDLSTPRVSVNNLGIEHLDEFTQSLLKIQLTDVVLQTYAQIIDSLPIRDVYHDYVHYHADIEKECLKFCGSRRAMG
jgi:hypothetical protein